MEKTPPYEQIAEHYRSAIRAGELVAGDELPSIRHLATEWDVATSTAQRVLERLRDEGWINTRAGRPPVVAQREQDEGASRGQ